jgi:hypothetical protein
MQGEEESEVVGRAKTKLWTFGLSAVGAAFVLLLFLLLYTPARHDGRENGGFEDDCCGTLVLRDGRMVLNKKQAVTYVVGQDAQGPYILPRTYVGAYQDVGFEVDGTRPATKLRLDRLPQPTRILLYDGGKPYLFRRKG